GSQGAVDDRRLRADVQPHRDEGHQQAQQDQSAERQADQLFSGEWVRHGRIFQEPGSPVLVTYEDYADLPRQDHEEMTNPRVRQRQTLTSRVADVHYRVTKAHSPRAISSPGVPSPFNRRYPAAP